MEGKWEYLSDSPPWGYGGRWKKFELNLSNIFEGCFVNGVSFVSFTRNGNKYNACLHRMEQYLVNGNEYTTQNEMDLHSKIRRVSVYYTNNSFKLWYVKPRVLENLVNIYEIKRQSRNRSYLFNDVSRDNQEFEFASLYFNRFLNPDSDQKGFREITQGISEYITTFSIADNVRFAIIPFFCIQTQKLTASYTVTDVIQWWINIRN
jgi:hypothetical protein